MRRRQLITFLVRPNSGWPQDLGVRHNEWVRLLLALSGMTYMLSSPSALSQELVTQDLEAASEQQVFNNACRTCYTIKEGDNRLGPNLYNIIGRQAGSLPDYSYSSAIKDAGFVWDEEKLGHFIANPDEAVPGNSMKPYSGLASSDDRKKSWLSCDQSRLADRDSARFSKAFASEACLPGPDIASRKESEQKDRTLILIPSEPKRLQRLPRGGPWEVRPARRAALI